MRDIRREHALIESAMIDLLEVGSWANEETKEYIRKHIIPNIYSDWNSELGEK